ncbi:MAG: gamma-glutamylcyclotransferase, partial [Clostridia bacterium]|nr:gamma-glutamylcyclotransferase [Clostridia bacterium]
MKEKYYIAYGSNLNVRQMMERCPLAKIKGVSEIPDYELLFKGSKTGSYLTIEPRKNSKVPVAIWTITEEDEKALDRYEGFPTFYYKKEMKLPVTFLSGETRNIDAFAYIMHENRKIGMPAFYYVET